MPDLTVINFEDKKKERQAPVELWSPKAVLQETLKDLESNEISPTSLIVIYSQDDEEGDTAVGFRVYSKDTLATQGMLSRVIWFLNE